MKWWSSESLFGQKWSEQSPGRRVRSIIFVYLALMFFASAVTLGGGFGLYVILGTVGVVVYLRKSGKI